MEIHYLLWRFNVIDGIYRAGLKMNFTRLYDDYCNDLKWDLMGFDAD